MLLVARADMQDPRFKEAVILATQAPDGHTVGVILNRPLQAPLSSFVQDPRARSHRGRVGYGGPVMQGSVVALFRSAEAPPAPAFHVLRGVYLSMHPKAVEPLLDAPQGRVRFFSGFSGWGPGQLRGEQDGAELGTVGGRAGRRSIEFGHRSPSGEPPGTKGR